MKRISFDTTCNRASCCSTIQKSAIIDIGEEYFTSQHDKRFLELVKEKFGDVDYKYKTERLSEDFVSPDLTTWTTITSVYTIIELEQP